MSRFYACISLTGGAAGALDAIDGDDAKGDGSNIPLADGDKAIVSIADGKYYFYNLDADSAAAENDPFVIAPDANAGDKRWIWIEESIPDADHFGGLESAVATISTTPMTLAVTTDQSITGALSIPATLNLHIPNKISISAASAQTITMRGLIQAPRVQFIGTNVTLALASDALQCFVYPEWWGIDGTADEVQINLALTCAHTGDSGYGNAPYVKLGARRYNIAAPITILYDELGLVGSEEAGADTIIHRTHTTGNSLEIKAADPSTNILDRVVVKNLTFYQTTNTRTAGADIYMDSVNESDIRDIFSIDAYDGIYLKGGTSNYFNRIRIKGNASMAGALRYGIVCTTGTHANATNCIANFRNCEIFGAGSAEPAFEIGLNIDSADGLTFDNCSFFHLKDDDVYIAPSGANHCAGIRFSDCYFDRAGDNGHTTGQAVFLDGSSTGTYGLISFNDCFFNGGGATRGLTGFRISATANASDVTLDHCKIFLWGEHGIHVGENSDLTGFAVRNCNIAGNNKLAGTSSGIYIADSVAEFLLENNNIGNTLYGGQAKSIVCGTSGGAGVSQCIVSGNNCQNNTDDVVYVYGTTGVRVENNIPEKQAVTVATPALLPYGATEIDSTDNAVNGTLGSGQYIGQIKTIVMTEASNSSTITIALHETEPNEVATFDAVNETGVFMWTGAEWVTIKATCTFL